MRKALGTLLVAAFAVAGGRVALAADRAGVGLEWAVGPTIQLGDFDMQMSNEFALSWKASDTFTLGVFNGSGNYHGERSYDDTVTVPGQTISDKIVSEGTLATSGIRINVAIPIPILRLEAGIEAGAMTLGASTETFSHSDGSAGAAGDWFAVPPVLPAQPYIATVTRGMYGFNGRIGLLRAETKTITTDVSVLAGLRFVEIPEVYALGRQKVNTTTTPKGGLDSITNYNNLQLAAVVAIWF